MIEDSQGSFSTRKDHPLTLETLRRAAELLDKNKIPDDRWFGIPYCDPASGESKMFITQYLNKKVIFFLDQEEISHEQGEEILKSIYGPLIKEKE